MPRQRSTTKRGTGAPRAPGGSALRKQPVFIDLVRELALALPAAEERLSYGTPAFFVRGTLFARMREDGETLVVKVDLDQRDAMIEAAPAIFLVTPHYQGHPLVLVRLAAIDRAMLHDVLIAAWRQAAPARLAASFDDPRRK